MNKLVTKVSKHTNVKKEDMNTEQNKKIEDLLSSLDKTARATAPDFFYTRLKARMEKELAPESPKPWVLRPAFAFAALILILIINAAVIFTGNKTNNTVSADNTDVTQSIASEYRINSNLTYEINQ